MDLILKEKKGCLDKYLGMCRCYIEIIIWARGNLLSFTRR